MNENVKFDIYCVLFYYEIYYFFFLNMPYKWQSLPEASRIERNKEGIGREGEGQQIKISK